MIEVSDDAPLNAPSPMLVNPLGMVTDVSEVAEKNEYSPILVALAGIE